LTFVLLLAAVAVVAVVPATALVVVVLVAHTTAPFIWTPTKQLPLVAEARLETMAAHPKLEHFFIP